MLRSILSMKIFSEYKDKAVFHVLKALPLLPRAFRIKGEYLTWPPRSHVGWPHTAHGSVYSEHSSSGVSLLPVPAFTHSSPIPFPNPSHPLPT